MLRQAMPLILLSAALVPALACDRGQSGADGGAARADQPEAKAKTAPAKDVSEAVAEGAGEDEVAKPADGDEGAAAGPAQDGKTRAAAVKAAAQAAGDETKTSRATFSKLLNDGRKAVKDKRYDDGIDLYREALTIDPASPKLLGELGFAAYKSGDLELAESSTRRAIDLAPPGSKGLGALYYNLGLIEEASERPAAARAAYERSLAVRPGNDIVASKLAKLGDGLGHKGPGDATGLCAALRREWDCYASTEEIEALPADEQDYAGQCDCSVSQRAKEGTGKSFIRAAAVLTLEGTPGYGGMLDEDYLAVETAGEGWQMVGQLSSGYSPGIMGISNMGEVEGFEFVELGDAPGEELRVVASTSELDSNMGINTLDYVDYGGMMVCYAISDEAGVCASFPTLFAAGTDILLVDEPCDEQLGEDRWELDLSFADGEVVVARKSPDDDLPKELVDLVGTHSFAEAVNYPAIERTPLH